jgi:hypothetical protein
MVAFGILETVLLALGIEVPAGRLEVGAFAFGNLMEVNGMDSGREIVEFDLEGNARSLIPQDHITDRFALSIFEFDFGLGRAVGWKSEQREEQSEGETGKTFHGFEPPGSGNYNQFSAPVPARGGAVAAQFEGHSREGNEGSTYESLPWGDGRVVHKNVEYTARKFQKS